MSLGGRLRSLDRIEADELDALADALDALVAIDAVAEVARTDATGDIYEIDEPTFARAKDALARLEELLP